MILVQHNGAFFPTLIEYLTGRQPAGSWVAHLSDGNFGTNAWGVEDVAVAPGQANTLDEAVARLAANIAATFPVQMLTIAEPLTPEQEIELKARFDAACAEAKELPGDAAIGMTE